MSASDERDTDDATDPSRIERQIQETRSHLTDTLTALEHKLSARQITTDVFDSVRDAVMGTGDGQKTMLDLIRRNPLPAAMIGVGLAWMALGTTPRQPRRNAAAAEPPVPETMTTGPEAALHLDGAARAHGSGSASSSRVGRLQNRAGAMMQQNPLAVGALGVVIGALIGVVLPMSRREGELLGGTQAQLADQVSELGRDALERARDVAQHAGRAAMDVVQRELGVKKPGPSRRNGTTDESIH